tara:strand:+ start:316 stop:447 length:132 start_codon:yes stop_codon:yes gene_type:complete
VPNKHQEIDTVIVITRENFNSSSMASETIQMVKNFGEIETMSF